MIAHKFLAAGAISPFTGFRWPAPGAWVSAASPREDAWVHACRSGDLPYWLDDELWRVELDGPVREGRYQIAAPRARLVAPVAGWTSAFRGEYARACALHARDLALPHLAPALRDAVAGTSDLRAIADAALRGAPASAVAGYLADSAAAAPAAAPAGASYVACRVASALGGLEAFEAERAWQARWLASRLGLGAA